MIWRINLLGHEVRSRVLRVVVNHFGLAECRCKRNVIFYTYKKIQVLAFSTDCVELIWNLLASLLLARACPSSEQPFVPLVFQHLDWMKRVLLSEVFLSFWRIPFDNFCCGYLWYLQRQPPCRDGTSKQGFVHDPDFYQYFVIEVGIANIILLCFSSPFLLIFKKPNF